MAETVPRLDGVGRGVEPFEADLADRGGYAYTTGAPLSSRLAHERLTQATLDATDFGDRRVIDVGCGDGAFTVELLRRAGPAAVHGVDPLPSAVEVAKGRLSDPRLTFAAADAYELPHAADSFDVAHLRALLHHVGRPLDALREALRVAATVVVAEPNGWNPGLKLFERVHPYHRAHHERSFSPRRIDRWASSLGGRVRSRQFVGFVPTFSPDLWARAAKRVEPGLERTPAVRRVACAHYVCAIEREGPPS